jgi:transcriptional regulator with XRE-family HTH domain
MYFANQGLSQEELAFECRVAPAHVSGVERGVRNPTVVVLQGVESSNFRDYWSNDLRTRKLGKERSI